MARRTGVPTMLIVAKRLCDLVTTFTPVLTTLYPTNAALLAALAAANAACGTLAAELAKVKQFGD